MYFWGGLLEKFRGRFFVVFMELITRREFLTFDGREGATKIEQVRKLWSFCDNIIITPPPPQKRCLPSVK